MRGERGERREERMWERRDDVVGGKERGRKQDVGVARVRVPSREAERQQPACRV